MRSDWSVSDPLGSDKNYPWIAEAEVGGMGIWVIIWAGQSRDDALADLKELDLNPKHRVRIREQP